MIAELPNPSVILFNIDEMRCGCALFGAAVGQHKSFQIIFDGYWQSDTMEGLTAYRVTPDQALELYRKTVAFHRLRERRKRKA
jgi:hypothetical protein